MVSPKHANFIVNDGTATAADVRAWAIGSGRWCAAERGVDLQHEVEFVGDWPAEEEA